MRVSRAVPVIRAPPNLRSRKASCFGWDAGDARRSRELLRTALEWTGSQALPQTPLELAESHHKGWRLAGTPLSPLGKWRRGYGDKEASVRIHFPKGGGGRYLT